MAHAKLPEADRDRILALHAAGKGRNEIAREVGRSASVVSKVVADAGYGFDREQTRHATAARRDDMRASRARLAGLLLDDAHRLREQLWAPIHYVEHGGKDYMRRDWDEPKPKPLDQLKIVQATGTAIGRHLDLEAHDAVEKARAGRAMLVELGRALGIRAPDDPATPAPEE